MTTRLLIIADDSFDDGHAVPATVKAIGDVDQVHVVAPVIASRLDTLTEDESAHHDARERARRVADSLAEHGIEVSSDYSTEDPYDTAVAALYGGDFDGVVVATTGEGHWREEGVLERLRDSTDVPVTHVTIDDGDA